jgi:protein required for attachment to host cells
VTTARSVLDLRQQAGRSGADDILVIAADDQRARLVRRRGASKALEVIWEGYAASREVRGLGQEPDIARSSTDATPNFPGEGRMQFAGDIAERVGRLVEETPSLRLLVIAPPSFDRALQHALGGMWPSLPERVIGRDETSLDDDGLLAFIRATLEGHPDWTSTVAS